MYALAVDDQDKFIYSGGGDAMLVQWNMAQEDGRLLAKADSAIYALAASAGIVAAGTMSGTLYLFGQGQLLRQLKISDKPIYRLRFSESGLTAVAGDGCIYGIDHRFNLLLSAKLSDAPLRALAKMPGGWAVSGSDSVIRITDSEFNLLDTADGGGSTVFALDYTQSSDCMFAGAKDARLRFYSKNRLRHELPAHLLHIHDLVLNPSQNRLLSSGMDKTIKLWDAASGSLLKVIDNDKYQAHRSSVNKILWFDKNTIISCSDDRTLMCFELQEKQ